ncbi:protein-export chaperone SecB [Clostridium perfringens]|uniref:protein-export chaperone SecB n=1 Tax=Clostridium perfringens TaxID=1502 RepID=UPI001C841429|nr:protein-export chaperone SecB [Clostridium perfringens]MDM0558399.1 protein-export chaperone SecB [Clostridium perfringens]
MKKSQLQFRNPILTKIEYKINNEFNGDNEIKLNIDLATVIKKNDDKAIVEVLLKIFDKNDFEKIPFFIEIGMKGDFSWEKNSDENFIDKLLETNGPAILISYIRPYVSSLTSGSGFAPLVLPLFNLSDNKVEYR